MADDVTEAGGKTRLYVTADLGEGVAIALDEGQAHYLLHVLRAQLGNRVLLFNGRDGEWLAQIVQATKRGVTAKCLKQTEPQVDGPDIWLAFAPVKKTPSDYLVQKATELGASVLLPVFTRRTIVSRINQERMAANAIEAAEQSRRLNVPEIREGVSFAKLLTAWPMQRRLLFCDEGGDAKAERRRVDVEPRAANHAGVLHALHALSHGGRRHADAARERAHRDARIRDQRIQDFEIRRVENAAYVIEGVSSRFPLHIA